MIPPKYKLIGRSVKHVFTTGETAALNVDFRNSFANLKAVEAEFDSVKASYKAKTTEAESRMETLNTTLQAGFEIRDKKCVLVMDFKEGKKYFFPQEALPEDWEKVYLHAESWPKDQAAIVEPITDADRQAELLEAEAKFEKREEIELFAPAGEDSGVLIVGRLAGKWFTALRIKIGTRVINERLDGKQDMAKLNDNNFIVVEAKDPSQVRFAEPPPGGYDEQEKAALALCRFMLKHEKGFTATKSEVTGWYVHFLMNGSPMFN